VSYKEESFVPISLVIGHLSFSIIFHLAFSIIFLLSLRVESGK
jgi:hypothetical protein